jgi:hypothetical protein
MVHQCPRCELRFTTTAEEAQHLAVDHGVSPEDLERYRYPSLGNVGLYPDLTDAPEATGLGVRRYLIVANQTLGGSALRDEVRRRSASGPARFRVVVPSTDGEAAAVLRLERALTAFGEDGVEAGGAVGQADPVEAVLAALREEQADEIILSMLPPGLSRWLSVDLPGRLRRLTRLPVTVIVAAPSRVAHQSPASDPGA